MTRQNAIRRACRTLSALLLAACTPHPAGTRPISRPHDDPVADGLEPAASDASPTEATDAATRANEAEQAPGDDAAAEQSAKDKAIEIEEEKRLAAARQKKWGARFVRTTSPRIDVDMSPFLRAGCTRTGYAYPSDTDQLDCSTALPPDVCVTHGAALIFKDRLLGGLVPRTPIARCDESLRHGGPSDLVHHRGGMSGPFVVLFVIIEDNRLHVIRTRSEFIQRFAPVTTEAEALAFAVALSEGRAEFDSLDYARESLQRPIAPVVRGTIVTPVADVFQVRLFDGDVFGCGAKMTYRFNATVTRRGAVRGSRAEALYQRQPGCVD